MKNIYIHELKQYSRSTIIWVVSLLAVTAFFLSIYPAMTKDIGALQKLIEGFPDALKKAFNISLDTYASIVGFYSFILTFITLAASIQAMIIGTSIVSKEERGKTAEFLLAKPVSRTQILNSKLGAGLTILLITNIILLVLMPILLNILAGETIVLKTFLLLSITILFVQLFFLALGFLISVAAPKLKSVLSISMSTVFAFYIISTLDSIIGSTTIRYFTPLKFYDYPYIAKNGSYEIIFVVIEAVLVIVAIVMSYNIYLKRDIRST